MKPYRKPILAVDSDRIIVIDDNVKPMSFLEFGLRSISVILILTLTVYGCAVGINTEAVSKKLESIDIWANQPGNQILIFFTSVGFIGVVLLTFVLYWVYKMFSK